MPEGNKEDSWVLTQEAARSKILSDTGNKGFVVDESSLSFTEQTDFEIYFQCIAVKEERQWVLTGSVYGKSDTDLHISFGKYPKA